MRGNNRPVNQIVAMLLLASLGLALVGSGSSGSSPASASAKATPPSPNSQTQQTQTQPQPLTLTVGVSGKGTVTSTPAGINCGKTCSGTYPSGTVVTLTATPGAGFALTGWGGACTGTGSCAVSMTTAQSVTATFRNMPGKH